MVAAKVKIKLVVIVGPTASGKSALAMKLAKKFNGEIICADSMTIYKGMDIGTAKPSAADQKAIRHWGLDLIMPGERFSASLFKDYALEAIADIQKRGKLPILVGGTGLYIDGVLFGYKYIKGQTKPGLEDKSTLSLQKYILRKGYRLPKNSQNRRHLIRTIERQGATGYSHNQLSESTLLIGIWPDDKLLKEQIVLRAGKMFRQGVTGETQKITKLYGEAAINASGGIIYKVCKQLLHHDISEDEAIELFINKHWQYARRQKTWFKRNKFIQWYESSEAAFTSVSLALNNQSSTTSP